MPFADQLIGEDVAEQLVRELQDAVPGRSLDSLSAATRILGPLSLRERSDALRDGLLADFPDNYDQLATAIRRAADHSTTFTGWMIWPVTSALATRAAEENSPAVFTDAMEMMARLTPRLSSEFAIRVLLRHNLNLALTFVQQWTSSTDEHVRRLASEGTRPYLPWAVRVPQIIAEPASTIPVLDALYRDPSEYVRRSVANHLNDISRHDPELVVRTAQRWMDSPDATTNWVVKHGLRTLIKRGNPGALAILGFGAPTVDIDGPYVHQTQVGWGQAVEFNATVRNTGSEPMPLAIDYVMNHRKANGSTTAKVFKLTTRTLSPGESFAIERSHSFRAITTRRYYPGEHSVALQINGVPTESASFELLADTEESSE